MKLEDIKVGMKVKLLSKNGSSGGGYDDIEDWFEFWQRNISVQQIKKQGYGIVTEIINDNEIWVSNNISGNEYCFSSSDLEPYEEESQEITKTPKQWLLTPSVICTTRNGMKFVVVSNSINVTLDSFNIWSYDLNLSYDEKLINVNDYPPSDIMKITYGKETVYERKEEAQEVKEMTIDEIEKIVGSKIKIVSDEQKLPFRNPLRLKGCRNGK